MNQQDNRFYREKMPEKHTQNKNDEALVEALELIASKEKKSYSEINAMPYSVDIAKEALKKYRALHKPQPDNSGLVAELDRLIKSAATDHYETEFFRKCKVALTQGSLSNSKEQIKDFTLAIQILKDVNKAIQNSNLRDTMLHDNIRNFLRNLTATTTEER